MLSAAVLDADDAWRDQVRSRAFALAAEHAADPRARQALDWLDAVLKATRRRTAPAIAADEAHFSPGDTCLSTIVRLFGSTRQKADVCVFTITDDRITSALLTAHRRGVAIRLLTDDEKAGDAGSDIDRIAAAGVQVKVDRTLHHMHHKFALFDDRRLLTGSYNWTRGAAEFNEENLIVTASPTLLSAFREQFERLWQAL